LVSKGPFCSGVKFLKSLGFILGTISLVTSVFSMSFFLTSFVSLGLVVSCGLIVSCFFSGIFFSLISFFGSSFFCVFSS
jgi:hypothetical protein